MADKLNGFEVVRNSSAKCKLYLKLNWNLSLASRSEWWHKLATLISQLPLAISLWPILIIIIHSKYFSVFWLVKTARIIHHNQLLLTKYWTNDVKSAARCRWTVDRVNLGTRLCHFGERIKQRAKWRNSSKNGEIFWMNNKAIIEFGFRRIWRILQISEGVIHLGLRPLWKTPSLICRILHILLSLSQ